VGRIVTAPTGRAANAETTAAQRSRRRSALQSFGGLVALLGLAGLTGLASVPVAQPAAAGGAVSDEVYPVPPSGTYSIHGRGFGHGHGMSQWGAYGAAAVDGLSAHQILSFYYPHTTIVVRSTTRTVRVLLTAADAPQRGYLHVKPATGLSVTPASGPVEALPTTTAKGHPITGWRLQRSGTQVELRDHTDAGWHAGTAMGTAASFGDDSGKLRVVQPDGVAKYRGELTAEIEAGSLEAVDVVGIEQYLRSVVPAEMPASWPAAALRAQAIAARTYTTHGRNHPKASWYDLDGDTRDQAYPGVGAETAATTKAVKATAGKTVVDPAGHAILAQYASADGGWTVAGGLPYLPAEHDPYDGAIPNTAHAWTIAVPASTIAAAFPQVGSLQQLVITGRDGDGLWGGRVTSVTVVGSSGSVATTGSAFQDALGLRSPWFRPQPTPAVPRSVTAAADGRTVAVTWKPPAAVKGAAPVTGYRVTVSPGGGKDKLPASARSDSVDDLAPGSYTVSVVARSDAGPGPAASVVVKTGDQ
jgi:SpoIID/LytB domain protein